MNSALLKVLLVVAVAAQIAVCASVATVREDALEIAAAVRTGSYDALAMAFSEYCDRADIVPILRERARLEIRRRGEAGPGGGGPIVRVYCRGEPVPAAVLQEFGEARAPSEPAQLIPPWWRWASL